MTGTRLAQLTNFRQAHISNFLNRKRALSLEGLDRVLAAQGLTIEDLTIEDLTIEQPLPVAMAAAADSIGGSSSEPIEAVPLVSESAAANLSRIDPASIVEAIDLPATRLAAIRSRPSGKQAKWHRFVALRSDAQQAAAIEPLLTSGSLAIIDRHYNSVAPYRAHERSLFAVRYGSGLLLRYVELEGTLLVLRPSALDYPVHLIALGPGQTAVEFIVGRVCLVFAEL